MTTLRGAEVGPVDAVVGGIPCQPNSSAGKGLGTDDPRWLWPHFLRLVIETGAGLGLVENVRGLLSVQRGTAFGTILREAVAAGFTVEWQVLAAATMGAPHLRERVFIVLRREGWTWPGGAQVGLFGAAPWASLRTPPADGWPVSGWATAAGWAQTPWAYRPPEVWPWLRVAEELVPTPAAGDAKATRNESAVRTPGAIGAHAGKTLTDWADPTNGGRLLPTPVAFGRGHSNEAGTTELERMVRGMTEGGDRGVRERPDGMLPTPSARDWRDGRASDETHDRNARPLNEVIVRSCGGKLRAEPVEWMMGWPRGWTLPDGDSLADTDPQPWDGWPDEPWTTAESPPHRRPRLKAIGNGVVGPVGERIGRDVLASVARARRRMTPSSQNLPEPGG